MQTYHTGPASLSNNSLLRVANLSDPFLLGFSKLMQTPPVASSRELTTDNKGDETQESPNGSSEVAVGFPPAVARPKSLSGRTEASSQERANTKRKSFVSEAKAVSWAGRTDYGTMRRGGVQELGQ